MIDENRPIEFQRLVAPRAARWITYALLIPFAGLLVSALVSGLVFGVVSAGLRWGENVATTIGLIVGLLTWVWFLIHSYREYRIRSSDRIQLFSDRMERIVLGKVEAFPYSLINRTHVVLPYMPHKQKVVVFMDDGRKCVLEGKDWPVGQVAKALEELSFWSLVDRSHGRIKQGEEVEFLEPKGQAVWLMVTALFSFVLGSLLLVLAVGNLVRNGVVNLHFFLEGSIGVAAGMAMPYWMRVVRGRGLAISGRGIRTVRNWFGASASWTDVKAVFLTEEGIRVEASEAERPLRASRAIGNYAALLGILRLYLPGDVVWNEEGALANRQLGESR